MTALAEVDVPRGTAVPLDARIHRLPLEFISIESNVRVVMAGLDELAASIAEQGVIQPIKVRHAPDGAGYIVTWGHRRLLASRQAGLIDIPAFIDDTEQTLEERSIEQLSENLNREDLNAIDRARALRAVVDAGTTQAELARKLGMAPSTIANDLRLLEASSAVQDALRDGQITAAHAKAMLPLPAKDQEYFVGRVKNGGLSAHRLEEEVGWKLQTIRGEEASRVRSEKQAPKLVAALEAAGIAKTTKLYLRTPYNMRGGTIEDAVKKAGWKLVDRYARERGPDSKCDCDVVAIDFNRSWKIEPACIDDSHRDRQGNVDHRADERRRKAIAERVAVLAGLVERALAATPMHPVVLRLGYRRRSHAHEWDELMAMPDAEVTRLYATNLADGIDPTYAYSDREAADQALEAAIASLGGEPPAVPAKSIGDGPRATTPAMEVTAAAPPGARQINLKDPVLIGDRPLRVLSISYPGDATRQSTMVSLRPIDLGKDIDVAIDRLAWDRKAKAWRVDPETPA